jgi:hypothetical protein
MMRTRATKLKLNVRHTSKDCYREITIGYLTVTIKIYVAHPSL